MNDDIERAVVEARQVLALTAVQKKPNPALIRLAQAVIDLATAYTLCADELESLLARTRV